MKPAAGIRWQAIKASEVGINGQYLGLRPYGFVPFVYELTPYLKYDAENVVAVKVDNLAADELPGGSLAPGSAGAMAADGDEPSAGGGSKGW